MPTCDQYFTTIEAYEDMTIEQLQVCPLSIPFSLLPISLSPTNHTLDFPLFCDWRSRRRRLER